VAVNKISNPHNDLPNWINIYNKTSNTSIQRHVPISFSGR